EPVSFTFRAVHAAAQPLGAVDLASLPQDGTGTPLRTALVAVPAAGLVRLVNEGGEVLAGSASGQPLRPVEGGTIVPQSDRVWLLLRGAGPGKLDLAALTPAAGQPLALVLPAGGAASLPALPAAPDRVRFWLAESGFGQPAVSAGRGMGVAPGAAFALA